MSPKIPPLTAEVEKTITAYVRAGGYPHIAAEAAGIPLDVFDEWLRKGEAGRPLKYKRFVEKLRQAEAQARLNAEVAAFKDKPMDWLKAGPGKETPAKPGWSALAKPRPGAAKETPLLMRPDVQTFLRALLTALEPHPEARAAVAAVLVRLREAGGKT
ncbi:MAG TPA: hypothetical protein VMS17_00265 [Gemmataceae bacterium]|nr:hypothetical protein [Gemmataceae bacterium]